MLIEVYAFCYLDQKIYKPTVREFIVSQAISKLEHFNYKPPAHHCLFFHLTIGLEKIPNCSPGNLIPLISFICIFNLNFSLCIFCTVWPTQDNYKTRPLLVQKGVPIIDGVE